MRIIAHVSDLHFGTEVPEVLEALEKDVKSLSPHVLAVSGDLTQRARRGQFLAAKLFLDRFDVPKVVVPGNHDIPLYDLFSRIMNPLGRYRAHFSWDLAPSFVDDEIAVLGFNTVRNRRWKEGHLGSKERARLKDLMHSVPLSVCRIVVTHHPLISVSQDKELRGIRDTLVELAAGGTDLVLAGHLHRGVSGDVRAFHPKIGTELGNDLTKRSIVFAEAGTAVSTRRRMEANGYNVIYVTRKAIVIATRSWDGKEFVEKKSHIYPRETCIGLES